MQPLAVACRNGTQMAIILLTKGKYAIVDDADYPMLRQFSWAASIDRNGYAYAARTATINGKEKFVRMHRLLLDAPPDMLVDHINGKTLDNRRSNLRLCTRSQNQWNRRRVSGRSRFKGVIWDTPRRQWRVQAVAFSKVHHVGFFDDEESAARAYDASLRDIHGEFSVTNASLGLL